MASLVTLKNRKEFLAAAASGRKWVAPTMVVQQGTREDGAIGVGFTATKKLGNAAVRNRIKRRLRETAKRVLPEHGAANHNYVLIGRDKALHCEFSALLTDLSWSLKHLHRS